MDENVYNELARALGKDKVTRNKADREAYAGGHSFAGLIKTLPDFIVRVTNVENVQKTLEIANRFRVPITPIMSATMDLSTFPRYGGIVMDTSSMAEILEINTDEGYALIEPGVTIGQLNKALRGEGFWAAFGSYPPWTCVLGNYSQRNHTSMRTHGTFDDVMGLEVVLADGTVLRTGSAAFEGVSWHTPYGPFPDLKGLFLNSYGMFGIFTKGAVRVHPFNERRDFSIFASDSYPRSIEYVRRIGRAGIVEHSIIWHWAMYCLFDLLMEITDEFPPHLMRPPWDPPEGFPYNLVTAQMSGYKENIQGNIKSCERVAKEVGGKIISHQECKERFPGAYSYWNNIIIEKQPSLAFLKGFFQFTMFPIFIAPLAKMAILEPQGMKMLYKKGLRFGMTYYSQQYDRCRSTSMRYTPFTDPLRKEKNIDGMAVLDEFYDWAMEKYGAVPMRVLTPRMATLIQKTGGYYKLWKRLKETLDPNNILNPGVIY